MKITFLLLVIGAVSAFSLPSREKRSFELNIHNRQLVMKALRCIGQGKCALELLKYKKLLKEAGPTLMMTGYCPEGMCTAKQESMGREIMLDISNMYPNAFRKAYQNVRLRFQPQYIDG